MRLRAFIIAGLMLLAGLAPSGAAATMEFADNAMVDETTSVMTERIQADYWNIAYGFDGQKLTPPPGEGGGDSFRISFEEERKVTKAGLNSGRLKWCGIESDAYFRQFLELQKVVAERNEYQMAYISLLLGAVEQFIHGTMAGNRFCDDVTKDSLLKGRDRMIEEWKTQIAAKQDRQRQQKMSKPIKEKE